MTTQRTGAPGKRNPLTAADSHPANAGVSDSQGDVKGPSVPGDGAGSGQKTCGRCDGTGKVPVVPGNESFAAWVADCPLCVVRWQFTPGAESDG